MKAPSPMVLDFRDRCDQHRVWTRSWSSATRQKDPWAAEWVKRNTPGSGPTRLVKNSPASRSCWRPPKGYWRPQARFQKVVLKFVPNEADRVLLLKRKAVDLVVGRPGLSPRSIKAFESEQGLQGSSACPTRPATGWR